MVAMMQIQAILPHLFRLSIAGNGNANATKQRHQSSVPNALMKLGKSTMKSLVNLFENSSATLPKVMVIGTFWLNQPFTATWVILY
jgi:hypothetical protein